MTDSLNAEKMLEVGDLLTKAVAGSMTVACAVLGHELGFYKVLGENISLTSDQLADLSNTNKRLTREWLDQQASSRLLSYDLDSDTYSMSAEGAEYLARPESATWLAGSLPTVRAAFLDMDLLIGAMKGDGGVGWGEHHECYFHGVTERFRPL
jgi:hypothetical protein